MAQRKKFRLSMKRLRQAEADALSRLVEIDGVLTPGRTCGRPSRTDPKRRCQSDAGHNTHHYGIGACVWHKGNSTYENAVAALMTGHLLAQSLNVTPWQALLGEVRRSAGSVAFLDLKIASAQTDEELEPGGKLHTWVRLRFKERQHLARVSKMAMDASVDQMIVAQMQLEGETIARVLTSTLSALGLPEDEMDKARSIMRRQLLALEAHSNDVHLNSDGSLEGSMIEDK